MADTTDFEAPPTDLITLTRHILKQQQELGERASGDLTMLLVGIQVSTGELCSTRQHERTRSHRRLPRCSRLCSPV